MKIDEDNDLFDFVVLLFVLFCFHPCIPRAEHNTWPIAEEYLLCILDLLCISAGFSNARYLKMNSSFFLSTKFFHSSFLRCVELGFFILKVLLFEIFSWNFILKKPTEKLKENTEHSYTLHLDSPIINILHYIFLFFSLKVWK